MPSSAAFGPPRPTAPCAFALELLSNSLRRRNRERKAREFLSKEAKVHFVWRDATGHRLVDGDQFYIYLQIHFSIPEYVCVLSKFSLKVTLSSY